LDKYQENLRIIESYVKKSGTSQAGS